MIRFIRGLRKTPEYVRHPDALADFLARHAAFVSQKSTIEYCRARAGVGWNQLVRDEAFTRAIERCRWEAYAAVLGDVAEVALIYLRRQGFNGPDLVAGLSGVAGRSLVRHPVPAHRSGWQDVLDGLAVRLRQAAEQAPRPVHEVGRTSGKQVFAVLPIHTNLAGHDREMVINSVRFLLCRVYAEMEVEVDAAAVGPQLTAVNGT